MSFKDDWNADRDRKRAEREAKQFARRMASPVARSEVFQFGELQLQHLASLALAIEALEDILVGQGLLEPDELMSAMKTLAQQKSDIAIASAVTADQAQV